MMQKKTASQKGPVHFQHYPQSNTNRYYLKKTIGFTLLKTLNFFSCGLSSFILFHLEKKLCWPVDEVSPS